MPFPYELPMQFYVAILASQPVRGDVKTIGLDIRAMQKAIEKMPPYQRGDCPICGWSLETAADGIIHCMFCGWQDQYPVKRDVFND